MFFARASVPFFSGLMDPEEWLCGGFRGLGFRF